MSNGFWQRMRTGVGRLDWNDESQREREGLDLRSAILTGINLQKLPLAGLRAGLDWQEGSNLTIEQVHWAATHFEYADLRAAHLENANLCYTHFEHAILSNAYFNKANMVGIRFFGATLINTCLREADLSEAHCEGAYLLQADSGKACLREVFFGAASNLTEFKLDAEVLLADVHWSDVNIAVIDWSKVKILGDEYKALKSNRIEDYHAAVRANRQLAVTLQSQGLNEDAARFAYRAQKLQRIVLRRQHKFLQYLFSLFLDVLAGYGYKPIRSLLWYLIVIVGFAIAYYLIGHLPFFPDSFVFSLTSFHGRGFFPGFGSGTTLHNPLVVLAAFEAVIGLFIEISFIATFTQRFFGK